MQLSKLDIATIQLDRAIVLFLDATDFVSAITLAGAAEEILGKLAENIGKKNALNELIDASKAMEEQMYGESEGKRSEYVSLANYYRDRLKHINDGEDLHFSVDHEAASLISRALDNYYLLDEEPTKVMREFEKLNFFGKQNA